MNLIRPSVKLDKIETVDDNIYVQFKFVCDKELLFELYNLKFLYVICEQNKLSSVTLSDMEFIIPFWVKGINEGLYLSDMEIDDIEEHLWFKSILDSEASYKRLIVNGVKPQYARKILTNSMRVDLVVVGSLVKLKEILTEKFVLRNPQFADVVNLIIDELKINCKEVCGELKKINF